MKIFYTERDIEEMHATGVTHIEISDNIVLTDLAREKAQNLGFSMVTGGSTATTSPPAAVTPATPAPNKADLIDHIKTRVIARLGSSAYNDLLDQIIPQILTQLDVQTQSTSDNSSRSSGGY